MSLNNLFNSLVYKRSSIKICQGGHFSQLRATEKKRKFFVISCGKKFNYS